MALNVYGGTLYAGGNFGVIGGASRHKIAALDTATGIAISWSPDVSGGGVMALAASGNRIYVGGDFWSVGGQPRMALAALDTATGEASGWDFPIDGQVYALASSGSRLYVGGAFTATVNGVHPYLLELTLDVTASVGHETVLPTDYRLYQNYPNPFNPQTSIRFDIPRSSKVEVKICNILGQEVATLLGQEMRAGSHEVTWDAARSPSGVYICRLHAGTFVQTIKLLLLR